MHPQLEEIVEEFRGASSKLDSLCSSLTMEQWARRPVPQRWSPAECVAHLNLTGEAFLPRIHEALADALPADGQPRYRRDLFGWLLWKTLPPPVRFRTKTAAPFVPKADDDPDTIIARFHDLQREQIELVRKCDGFRIDRVKIASPFDARVRYNLFSALSILPRHQQRHLWQAERNEK